MERVYRHYTACFWECVELIFIAQFHFNGWVVVVKKIVFIENATCSMFYLFGGLTRSAKGLLSWLVNEFTVTMAPLCFLPFFDPRECLKKWNVTSPVFPFALCFLSFSCVQHTVRSDSLFRLFSLSWTLFIFCIFVCNLQ